MSEPIIIVGAGLAGYNVARELRKLDRATPLVLIARDDAHFYSKPMLSNALAGGKAPAALVMKSCESMAEELNATILAQTEVQAIEASARRLILADGRALGYRDLVLALGADPVRPLLAGEHGAVLAVNDLSDYAHFLARLPGQGVVVILGAGLIGCEFANDLVARGLTPVLVDPAAWPLARLLPQEAGRWMQDRLQQHGVSFHLGRHATQVDCSGPGYRVTLDDGTLVDGALVLSAIGLGPRVSLARAAGLTVARGIVTGADLRTSDPHIWAVGDCVEAAGFNLPFVMPLMQQARSLAATLAGQPMSLRYPAMPIVVKTPACPTVIAPPLTCPAGAWQVDAGAAGLTARWETPEGVLGGFVLMGDAVRQRQTLSAQLGNWLA
ncbi:FAD-dependent oxidoreductase [Chitiniphilus purpureus]|uniref:FAD-dependent oxidoreductase n=1 Tax=Chitiniphilus purpureus TaxID=2981137 RepID=A0ABY6DIT4_9NEIS|nr:FAD-dependent oxidoreductase [Chitiniphilus sp. CD1]UXY14260.1 FAD-dependent oxidoreductase [Chitiniphilus sp. CD1]